MIIIGHTFEVMIIEDPAGSSHRSRCLLACKDVLAVQHGRRAHDIEREGAADDRVSVADNEGEVRLLA